MKIENCNEILIHQVRGGTISFRPLCGLSSDWSEVCAAYFAKISSNSNIDILFQLLRFYYPVFVSTGDMNMFEERLSDSAKDYVHLYGSSQNAYTDCQMAKNVVTFH